MRLHRLRLSGFRHLAEADIRFDDGLTVVTGGNGAGKTTLLEGITWTLYGAGAVRGAEQSLRASVRLPPAAELHFSLDGADYSARRQLGDSDESAVLLDGSGRRIAAGLPSFEPALAAVLGAERETVIHACFTGRRELHQLAQLTPPQRLRTLARLLGRGSRPAGDMPRAEAARWTGSVARAAVGDAIHALEQELAEADERMQMLLSAPELLTQYAAELERLLPQLRVAEAQAERLHDEWAQKRQDVETRLTAHRSRADELKLQIERLSARGDEGTCPTCGQSMGTHADRMLERLDDEALIIAQDTKWLLQRQQQLARRAPDLVAAETRRNRLRRNVEELRERSARCEQAAQELWTVAVERKRAAERLAQLRSDVRGAPELHDTGDDHAAKPAVERAELDAIAAEAGDCVRSMSAGCYDGIDIGNDGRIYALRSGTRAGVISGSDEDMIVLSLRLAALRRLRHSHPQLRMLCFDEPFGSMDADRTQRALEVLRSYTAHAQVVLCTRHQHLAAAADHVLTLPLH